MNERQYFVAFEDADEIIITVKDDVNRPNNLDCDQVLHDWINENYGSDAVYDYWELSLTERIVI